MHLKGRYNRHIARPSRFAPSVNSHLNLTVEYPDKLGVLMDVFTVGIGTLVYTASYNILILGICLLNYHGFLQIWTFVGDYNIFLLKSQQRRILLSLYINRVERPEKRGRLMYCRLSRLFHILCKNQHAHDRFADFGRGRE